VIRDATAGDAEEIAAIFNAGVGERVATFQTLPQSAEDVERWISDSPALIVAESDQRILGFAKVGPYDDAHHYYDSVGEATLYVAYEARRSGVGRELMEAVAIEAERRGFHKLVGKIFTSNEPSIALVHAFGTGSDARVGWMQALGAVSADHARLLAATSNTRERVPAGRSIATRTASGSAPNTAIRRANSSTPATSWVMRNAPSLPAASSVR